MPYRISEFMLENMLESHIQCYITLSYPEILFGILF